MNLPPILIPREATGVRISFGPEIAITWPSLEVESGAEEAWATWDVWDSRGHVQGAHRLQSGVSFDRACEVAERAMDMTAALARDAFMLPDVLEREKREVPDGSQLHVGDVVRFKATGLVGKVSRFANDGTTDFWIDDTGPYKQADVELLALLAERAP